MTTPCQNLEQFADGELDPAAAATFRAYLSVEFGSICPAWACTSAKGLPVSSASIRKVRRASCREKARPDSSCVFTITS